MTRPSPIGRRRPRRCWRRSISARITNRGKCSRSTRSRQRRIELGGGYTYLHYGINADKYLVLADGELQQIASNQGLPPGLQSLRRDGGIRRRLLELRVHVAGGRLALPVRGRSDLRHGDLHWRDGGLPPVLPVQSGHVRVPGVPLRAVWTGRRRPAVVRHLRRRPVLRPWLQRDLVHGGGVLGTRHRHGVVPAAHASRGQDRRDPTRRCGSRCSA